MSGEIDSLSSGIYYSPIQNTTRKSVQEKNKSEQVGKKKFSSLLKTESEKNGLLAATDFPPEIEGLSVEDAAVFLKDAVEINGDELAQDASAENLEKFKKSVQQFILFVVQNNFELSAKKMKGFSQPLQTFSKYNSTPHEKRPRVQLQVINQKLDELTRAVLFNQADNLKILKQVGEIKGLIVDLMQS